MIYFMQPPEGGSVKIGFSDNVEVCRRRLESIFRCSLVVLAIRPGGRAEERRMHKRFAHLRFGRTEQFRPAADLMGFIGRPDLALEDPDSVESLGVADDRITVIFLKGTQAYADWLDEFHRDTHIPKATILRLAMRDFAESRGLPLPPEI